MKISRQHAYLPAAASAFLAVIVYFLLLRSFLDLAAVMWVEGLALVALIVCAAGALLAGLINALKVVGKEMGQVRIAMIGMGAANVPTPMP